MEAAITALSWACLVAGSAFAIIGGVGLLRLPDFYARMHGGGITDTMGAGLILTGLSLQAGLSLVTIKLLLILVFSLIASPTSGYALAKSARTHGLKPMVVKPEER
jgi:multicomponent Na+:H+ antiporter subunit G